MLSPDERWSPGRRPTEEMLKAEVVYLQEMWEPVHRVWADYESYVDRTYDLWPNLTETERANRPVYHSGRPASYINKYAGNLLAYSPSFKRNPKKGTLASAGDMTRADMIIEPWCKAMWELASEQSFAPLGYQMAAYLGLFNFVILEGPTVEELEPPQGEEQWNPIQFSVPHPSDVLLNPFERRLSVVVKRGVWYVRDLLRMSEERSGRDERTAVESLGLTEKKPFEALACYEYWTEDWHAFLVEEKLLFVEPNDWGFIPYQYGFGHFGRRVLKSRLQSGQAGVTGPQNDLLSLCKGLLEPILDDIRVEDQRKAAQQEVIIQSSFLPLETTKSLEEAQAQLGEDIRAQTQEGDYRWAKIPEYPAFLFNIGQENREAMDFGTFSPVLAGYKQKGTPTLGQQALMVRYAAQEYVPEIVQIGALTTKAFRKTLQLVEGLKDPVWAGGQKLEAKDIGGNYSVWAEFENLDPVLQSDVKAQADADIKEGRISYRDWADATRREDAMGSMLRVDFDRVRQSPGLQEVIVRLVEMGLGLDKLKAQLGILPQPPAGLMGPDGKPLSPPSPDREGPVPQGGGGSMEGMKEGLLRLGQAMGGGGGQSR